MTDLARGIAFALAAGLIYGLAPPFTRLAFVNGVPAIETAFWRIAVLVLIVGALLLVKRSRVHVPKGSRLLVALMAASTCAISIGYLGAVQFIPVALAVIIFFTFPIVIILLSRLVEGTRISPVQLIIGAVAFAGLLIAVGPSSGDADLRGVLLAGLASAGAAAQFFVGRALAPRMKPVHFGFLAHLLILPVLAALVLILGGQFKTVVDTQSIAMAGVLALLLVAVSYGGGYFCQMYSLKSAPPASVAPFFNIEPVTSVVAAALVLAEPPAANELAGGALVLAALVAAGVAGRREARQDSAN